MQITIIKSVKPKTVGKLFYRDPKSNEVKKQVTASITEGVATTHDVTTTEAMLALVREVTEADDLVICPGVFHGAQVGVPFRVVSEAGLADLLGVPLEQVPGGIVMVNGQPYAARVKRGISPSCWQPVDIDNPPGTPVEWLNLSLGQRLVRFDAVLPGISACERIELRSSSSRVLRPGGTAGERSHAWIRLDGIDTRRLDLLRTYIRVQSVNVGLSFIFEKHSKETGVITGTEPRTLIDASVYATGRLVFCSRPVIAPSLDGYTVTDADITLVNAGGGALKVPDAMPGEADLLNYKAKTGTALDVSVTPDGSVHFTSTGQLTLDTEIERRGVIKPLEDWCEKLREGERMRCETPFRESASEAAFIRMGASGPFLFDVGTSTKYELPPGSWMRHEFGKDDSVEVDDDSVWVNGHHKAKTEEEATKRILLKLRRVDSFTAEYEPASYLIDYMLQLGFLYSLTAETGAGKTALMILVSALVSTGKPFGDAEVRKGNVIYCVGENADEFRQRMICLRESSFDPDEYNGIHVLTPESHKGLLTAAGAAEVAAYAQALGGVDLVVVDTAAAFFDGAEENSNTELGEYARRLRRRLCTLPGRPCVVVCSHPTKNATKHDDLVPRGGGAFVAEVDGNLTLMKRDVGKSEMFWSKKFRGRIENPIQIALTPVEANATKDAKGRPLRSVLASVAGEPDAIEEINERMLRDRIVGLLADGRARTVTDIAIGAHEMLAGQQGGNENAGWKRTNRELKRLSKNSLAELIDGRWKATTKGKRYATSLSGGKAQPEVSAEDISFDAT